MSTFNNIIDTNVTSKLIEQYTQAVFPSGGGPDSRNPEYVVMSKHWEPIDYLCLGTLGMREAATKYLPTYPNEKTKQYQFRLAKAVLYGAYTRTIKSMAQLPFITPVLIPELPTQLEYLKNNVDTEGNSIDEFAKERLADLLKYGLCHILVEYPKAPAGISRADEMRLNLRPYLCAIKPTAVIGWDQLAESNAENKLGSVRIEETFYQKNPENRYIVDKIEQIRELTPGVTMVWQTVKRETPVTGETEWKAENIPTSMMEIPLITIYANKTGFMTAQPLLEELAHLNIQHWQKSSDLEHSEFIANIPFLFGAGFGEDASDLTVGQTMVINTNIDAKLTYVEHSGQALGMAHETIREIEARMVAMGADLLSSRGSSTRETATSKLVDNSKSMSILQATVVALEIGLEKAIKLAAKWMKIELPELFEVNIGDKMNLTVNANEITDLIQVMMSGVITPEAFVAELQRRGVLSSTVIAQKLIEPKEETSKSSPKPTV